MNSLASAVAGQTVSKVLFMSMLYLGSGLVGLSLLGAGWQTAKLWKERAAKSIVQAKLDKATAKTAELGAIVVELRTKNFDLFNANEKLLELNSDERATRETLQAALNDAVAEHQRVEALARAARRARIDAETALAAASAELESVRRGLYANDTACGDWSRVAMCGALSRSLRDEWSADQKRAGDAGEAGDGVRALPSVYADPAGGNGAAGPGRSAGAEGVR